MTSKLLFVYGSLLRGSRHPMARRLALESRKLGPATVTGRLYDLGFYPGAVPSANPQELVHGELLMLYSRTKPSAGSTSTKDAGRRMKSLMPMSAS